MPTFDELASSISAPREPVSKPPIAEKEGGEVQQRAGWRPGGGKTDAEKKQLYNDGYYDVLNANELPNIGTTEKPHWNVDETASGWKPENWRTDKLELDLPPENFQEDVQNPCMTACAEQEVLRAEKCDILRRRTQHALKVAGCPSVVLPAPPERGGCDTPCGAPQPQYTSCGRAPVYRPPPAAPACSSGTCNLT
jgi:hypothetical protein